MAVITRKIDITVFPTAEELAQVFCDMGEKEQAIFFKTVGEISDCWPRNLCYQLQAIVDSDEFDGIAKRVMEQLGEYGRAGTAKSGRT